MAKPKLLVLDDYEGELAQAPAMTELYRLTEPTVLNSPISLSTLDDLKLRDTHIVLALRERTKLNKAFFESFPSLELVLQTGGHAYHIDTAAATEAGVVVALGRNHTTKPPIVMPELFFGLLLGLVRKIYFLNAEMAKGRWPQAVGGSLHGRTLGILGYGRHGKPVARLAVAFGMKVIAWGRDLADGTCGSKPDECGVVRVSLENLLRESDVVSVHLKLSEESRGMLGHEHFQMMKETALLINTSRGAIVKEDELVTALQNGEIGGAGLDVFQVEPLPPESPLRKLPNVLLTPHVGWQVRDVFHEFVSIAAKQLQAWLQDRARGIDLADILNPAALSKFHPEDHVHD